MFHHATPKSATFAVTHVLFINRMCVFVQFVSATYYNFIIRQLEALTHRALSCSLFTHVTWLPLPLPLQEVEDVQQWAFKAAASALEVIPRTLAQNCGTNVVRVLTQLRVSTGPLVLSIPAASDRGSNPSNRRTSAGTDCLFMFTTSWWSPAPLLSTCAKGMSLLPSYFYLTAVLAVPPLYSKSRFWK